MYLNNSLNQFSCRKKFILNVSLFRCLPNIIFIIKIQLFGNIVDHFHGCVSRVLVGIWVIICISGIVVIILLSRILFFLLDTVIEYFILANFASCLDGRLNRSGSLFNFIRLGRFLIYGLSRLLGSNRLYSLFRRFFDGLLDIFFGRHDFLFRSNFLLRFFNGLFDSLAFHLIILFLRIFNQSISLDSFTCGLRSIKLGCLVHLLKMDN